LAAELSEAEHGDARDWADRRLFGTDKAWHALDYLLTRKDFPLSIVFGEEPFDDDSDNAEADWGYGGPRYLTPKQVHQAAVALAALTEDDLIDGVDPADLQSAGIYPTIWDRPNELPWVASYPPDVKSYFGAAAKAGDAIICWIG
jgi:hypothetical protein